MPFISWNAIEEVKKLTPLVSSLIKNCKSDTERAIAIYKYVRDDIAFGFTARFDIAAPSYTVEQKRGHCNPKASLFACMLKAANIKARVCFVHIHLYPLVIDQASGNNNGAHAYTEVYLPVANDSKYDWIPVDGYVVDSTLFQKSQEKLRREGKTCGYWTQTDAQNEWDGKSPCMSQYSNESIRCDSFIQRVDVEQLEQFYGYNQPWVHYMMNSLPEWGVFDSAKMSMLDNLNAAIAATKSAKL